MAGGVNFDGIAALVAAGLSGLATMIGAVNRRTITTTETKVEKVHAEVATSNGNTLGELVEQNLAPSADGTVAVRDESREA